MRTIIKFALLIIVGLGIYIGITIVQSRAAANLCTSYPVGTKIESLDNLNDTFLLTRMGPINDPKQPSIKNFIFCANLTMCDTSCSLVIENGLVKQSNYSAY